LHYPYDSPGQSEASPWEKTILSRANPERVQHRTVQVGKSEVLPAGETLNGEAERPRFVVPFQGTENDNPVPQGGASLALGCRMWNPFRIRSHPNRPVFALGVQVPDGAWLFKFQ